MSLQLLDNKALSQCTIGKSAPVLAEITIRKSQEDEPAEYEAMAPAPYGGHAAKDQGHKAREIGEGDQHVQSPLQRRERAKS